jgi:hypothetical protein
LYNNYPNPFNPSTRIKFAISSNLKRQTSDVILRVYDVLGNEVATLVNEELPAGEHEIIFDASNLTSGIYFYQLSTVNVVLRNKMVLMK